MGTRGRRLAGALTAVVTACFAFVGAAAPTTPAAVDYLPIERRDAQALLRQVTQRVMSFGCAAANNGTAVSLDDGTVLTAAHVVAGTRLINVIPDLGPTTVATAEVSSAHDIAVLRQVPSPSPASPAAHGVRLAPDDPPAGTHVLVAGYPHGQLSLVIGTAVIDGRIDGRSVGQSAGPVLRVRTRAATGMSGGPLLDPAGRVAGILVATRSGTDESFAIPASTIRAALAAGVTQPPAGGC
jgi:S1-C subfamily serine protease